MNNVRSTDGDASASVIQTLGVNNATVAVNVWSASAEMGVALDAEALFLASSSSSTFSLPRVLRPLLRDASRAERQRVATALALLFELVALELEVELGLGELGGKGNGKGYGGGGREWVRNAIFSAR